MVKKSFRYILVVGVFVGLWSFFVEPSLLTQKNIAISKWQGPKLRIAFFSDLHAGSPYINEEYILNLIQRINDNSPDLILIGGDLLINGIVGGSPIPIEKIALLLKNLKAPLGVYLVLGNHDWWNDGFKVTAVMENYGVLSLDNKSKLIRVSNQFSFWLVGIGDEFTNHANVKMAFSQVVGNEPRILFMHDPAAIFQVKENFFFAFAGHLHGGQVYVPGIGALITPGDAPKSWAKGWVDFQYGSIFVSKGIGTSILPVRMNALPEFVILELGK